ncbi:hypothetical protein AN214_04269 [Pseudoalteromonas sp. P1-9]|nr:hypothetical protein AN214_04269 [Pseudoalteromonas sp. P1-9]
MLTLHYYHAHLRLLLSSEQTSLYLRNQDRYYCRPVEQYN